MDYIQLLMIGQAILAKLTKMQKKGTLSHQKMKCSVLDYVQLLMIGWAIWAMKVDKSAPPTYLRMTWNSQFCPSHNLSHFSPPKWLRITQNGQFCLICNFSNLFRLKWLRKTWNGQICLICNFSNLFPPKWLRMTQRSQFSMTKKKNTMIQGNFYERLHFYINSCAIRPIIAMASLFISAAGCNRTGKKNRKIGHCNTKK